MKKIICLLMSLAILCSCVAGVSAASFFVTDEPYPAEEIADGIYKISDYGMDYMYLIIGGEKALLIDTGIGDGDIKQRVSELTDLPVVVAATHGHVDHIGGAGQFDEIYMHPDDFSMINDVTVATRKSFVLLQKAVGLGDSEKVYLRSIENFGETKPVEMPDGYIFDLGGRSVTVTHIPGHTKGSCMFTDSRTKTIIGGDNTGIGILMFFKDGATMEHYAISMRKVYAKALEGYSVYGGHEGSTPLSGEKISSLASMAESISVGNLSIFSKIPLILPKVDFENKLVILFRTDKLS